jgi:transposase
MATVAVGVDMAKASFVAAVCVAGQLRELGTQPNDGSGFTALQRQLAALPEVAEQDVMHLVVEPTGGYEQALVAFAYAQGWQVSLPNPKQVRDWAKGIGQRAKTDRQDALLLARFAAERQPAPQQPLPMEVSELDSLLKRRQELAQMLHQERMRQQTLGQRPGIAGAVVANLQRVIEALQEALAEVEQAIEQQMHQHAHLHRERRRLLALPGVGPKTVLPLVVLLYRWQAVTNGTGDAKGLTAFVGLDPQLHESGRSVHQPATISKMGDSEVRRLLYMGALGGVRGHNPLRLFYQRLRGRGKAAKVALVAAARKILVWAWTIFHRQTDWNPAYVPAD